MLKKLVEDYSHLSPVEIVKKIANKEIVSTYIFSDAAKKLIDNENLTEDMIDEFLNKVDKSLKYEYWWYKRFQ